MSEGDFIDRIQDERSAVVEFERHIEEVRSHVPSERLLVFEVAQGWQPLCEFLEVAVPEGEPFPWLNDRESFKELISRQVARDRATPPSDQPA